MAAIPPWGTVLILYSTFGSAAGVTLLFARLLDRRTWTEIGLTIRPTTPREILWGVLLAATVVVQVLLYVLFRLVVLHRSEDSIIASVLYGLVLFAGVGFWEELIFRGYVLPNLAELTGRVPAIILSSVLFWSIHLMVPEARDPATAVGLVLMGVVFCLCYLGTGSLWLPMALHACLDFLVISLFHPHPDLGLPTILTTEVLAPPWLVGPPGKAGALDLLHLAVLLAIVYFAFYRSRQTAARDRLPQPTTSVVFARPERISGRTRIQVADRCGTCRYV
jgi:hypothetical protein